MQPDITICICTYDRYNLISKAFESVTSQTIPKSSYEIIVVDNSGNPEQAEIYKSKFENIANAQYIVEETPGLSNARNVAAQGASAPIIAFMDDDAVAYPDWAQEILRAFDQAGETAMIVGGAVEPIWSAPRPGWLHDSMLGNLSVIDWGGETRIAAPHEWVAGTNVAFRIDAILSNGGFQRNLGRIGAPSTLLSNEEIALAARIKAAGGVTIYAPKARVRHLIDSRRLTQAWFRKRAAWQAFSDFMMAPDKAAAEAKAQWPHLVKYFNALPPLERTVRGLAFATDDPELFRWQTSAIYVMSSLLLAGFEGVELG